VGEEKEKGTRGNTPFPKKKLKKRKKEKIQHQPLLPVPPKERGDTGARCTGKARKRWVLEKKKHKDNQGGGEAKRKRGGPVGGPNTAYERLKKTRGVHQLRVIREDYKKKGRSSGRWRIISPEQAKGEVEVDAVKKKLPKGGSKNNFQNFKRKKN